jgi:hypothetical protein
MHNLARWSIPSFHAGFAGVMSPTLRRSLQDVKTNINKRALINAPTKIPMNP